MGRDLAEMSSAAKAVWEAADDALGESISRLAWEGPADELDLTANAQPALLAASAAAQAALDDAVTADPGGLGGQPAFYAGHSMGQYSAMVAAGVLSIATAIALVRERGRLMQASSNDGAMAAVIELDDAGIAELVETASTVGILTVANRNSPGQTVISGERPAVEAAADGAKRLGARRAIVLPVSVAAHSPLMIEAAAGMRIALADIAFSDPRAPLLANADASLLTTGAACRGELIEHLTRGVNWVATVERMADAGVGTFVEVGPGKVLTGLVRRITSDTINVAMDDITTVDGIRLPSEQAPQE